MIGIKLETRHYISFAVAIVLLQIFLWIFTRTLNWWLGLTPKGFGRKLNYALCYLGLNALVLTSPLRLFQDSFRLAALILALLLFSAFASGIVGMISWLSKGKIKNWLRLAYPIIFATFICTAIYNAYTPVVRHYQVQLDKPMQPLRIGMASDTHLGKLFGAKQLDQLADIFNQQQVDIILLPGDIMDDNVNAYLAEKMQPHLAKLQAPLGVYATLGNHDFFGDQKRIADEIKKAGIQVLMDSTTVVDNRIALIGRNDDLVKDRPSTASLLAKVDQSLPVILLDHRPTDIEQHAKLPIDIQLSGHAHNGQVFPANFVTKFIYRLHYGYEKIGNGHFFVTSGYGFWGIPFRLGSQSEVMIIDVIGK